MQFKLKLPLIVLGIMSFGVSAAFAATDFAGKEINVDAGYWTPERLQNAKPMPMPTVDPDRIIETPASDLPSKKNQPYGDGKAPEVNVSPQWEQLHTPAVNKSEENKNNQAEFNRGTLNQEFTSSRLVPLTADLSYPYRAVGKLFFTIPGQGDYVCSASVVRQRIVLTAGHCLHKGSGGSAGYYTNFRFIPAYRDGAAPYQSWSAVYAVVTSTWATGNGTVPNAADYGMLEMRDNTVNGALTRLGAVTGYFGYQISSLTPNHAHLLGYPCNLDSCVKMHQTTAQSARAVSPNNVEYGSDMRGGASGGPWVQNFGALAAGQTGGNNPGLNRVIGVTSYGYISTDPKALGASNFDSRFTNLLSTICAHRSGNCA